jgi:hypothetical protein
MRTVVQDEQYGQIVYEEGFWTGKRYIVVNGQALSKLDKKTYRYTKSNGENVDFSVKGNFLTGVALVALGTRIQVVRKIAWFEWLFLILTLSVAFVWGNNQMLCSIFPVVGGAIGGALGAICASIPMVIAKFVKNKWLQALLGLAGFLAVFVVGHLAAITIALSVTALL